MEGELWGEKAERKLKVMVLWGQPRLEDYRRSWSG